jgi:hypothetical protein
VIDEELLNTKADGNRMVALALLVIAVAPLKLIPPLKLTVPWFIILAPEFELIAGKLAVP